jgi:hypothetical protein
MKVFVYWNLHKKCWSLRAASGPFRGKVCYHARGFIITDAIYKVSEAGRQRVLRERKKNVHAGIQGTLESFTPISDNKSIVPQDDMVTVSYNPYRGPYFYQVVSGEKITQSSKVCATDRVVYATLT